MSKVNADKINLDSQSLENDGSNNLQVKLDPNGGVTKTSNGLGISAVQGVHLETFDNSDLTSGILTVTHPLEQKVVSVTIADNNGYEILPDDIKFTDTENLNVDLSTWGTISGTWTVFLIKSGDTNEASGGGLESVSVTSNTSVEDGKCYIANSASNISFTLPSTMAEGFHFAVIGKGSGGWDIKSNASATSQKVVKKGSESAESSSESIVIYEDTVQFGYAEFYCTTANSVITEVSEGTGVLKLNNYFGDGSDGNLDTSGDVTLTSTTDGDMVVKNYQDVTINTGDTLTVSNRCRGLLMFVDGDLTVDGTISMTARGCHANPAESTTSSDTPVAPGDGSGVGSNGIRLPFFTSAGSDTLSAGELDGCGTDAANLNDNFPSIDSDGTILQIPRTGGAGGAGVSSQGDGNTGSSGSNGQTGGGGSGGEGWSSGNSPDGGDGTCFSGGVGSGGDYNTSQSYDGISDYGGAGGDGTGSGHNGGGAGNPGGTHSDSGVDGENGTGGLLIIICSGTITVNSSGIIESNGKDGGARGGAGAGGGGSAGGSINLVYVDGYTNSGTVESTGGSGGYLDGSAEGGDGGAGSIQTLQVS